MLESSVWTLSEAKEIFSLPFMDLLHKAHTIHRENFDPNQIQLSTLLSIKTGGCPENCAYCPQSAHHAIKLKKEPLMALEDVLEAALAAKKKGATRFCMGGAWRSPLDKDLDKVCDMVTAVKDLGMETCVTLGMLKPYQAEKLKEAGLDFYNHNIDTSKEYYSNIITTRVFEDRLETLKHVQDADIKVCCGGILGMGESDDDRLSMLVTLASFRPHIESVTINKLIAVPGTPLANQTGLDSLTFIRTIAVARIMMPQSYIRLSAGRDSMTEEMQAWCFFAGANSAFYGDTLLTEDNNAPSRDDHLFQKLGTVFESA